MGRDVFAQVEELRRGLNLDYLFIMSYTLLGILVFTRFWVEERQGDCWRHPGALVGAGLVLATALADLGEDGFLAGVLDNGPESVSAGLLGRMRAVGMVKWTFLAAAAMALVILFCTRERKPYLPGDPSDRPEPPKPPEPAGDCFRSGNLGGNPSSLAGRTPDAKSEPHPWDPPGDRLRTGVCLSGGGIRSAAFSLGGLQALQRAGVMERTEYLAAASGGGYLAAGWALSDAEEPAGSERTPWSPGSPEERWFRDHSSYLVPDLLGGLRGVGRILAGVVVNVLLIWLLLFVIARPIGWMVSASHPELRAVEPVALPRDAKGEVAIELPSDPGVLPPAPGDPPPEAPPATPESPPNTLRSPVTTMVTNIDVVEDGATVQAQRYQIHVGPAAPKAPEDPDDPDPPGDGSAPRAPGYPDTSDDPDPPGAANAADDPDDSVEPDDTPDPSPNRICFDTEPFNPGDKDHCFAVGVEKSRPVTVEVRSGKAEVVRQPRVIPSMVPESGIECPAPVRPIPSKPRPGFPVCQVFDRIEVLRQPVVSLRESTVTDPARLPYQLEVSEQPVLRTRTGLVGRPDLAFDWWMWEATLGSLAAAAVIGLVMMTRRTRGQRHAAGRFAAMTFSLTGLAFFAVTLALPVLILWLPTVGQNVTWSGSNLADYLLPSGGLLALAFATSRQFLSANRAGKGTGPAQPSKPEAPVGIFGRIWAWLTKGKEQLSWYELTPLKVLLGVVLLLAFVMFFVAQLQYASANGPGGKLMGFGFVRNYLPSWMWWTEWQKWSAVALLLCLIAVSVDAHAWSLFPFYKRALTSGYLVQARGGQTRGVEYDRLIPLTGERILSTPDYDGRWPGLPGSPQRTRTRPKLVLCCAVNLSEYGMVPPGRRAASFTFGPDYIGGPLVGYQPAHEYWKNLPDARRRDITLPSAMAISGAAFSPAMGKTNLGPVGSLLAIANLRLGVWLPHPQRVTPEKRRKWHSIYRPGWLWFFREVTNTYKFQRRYLYVSDGGHWDNLGLVELLRRGCTEIICISAAGDGAKGFGTISEAMALAREELGVEWDFDPTPVRPPIKASKPVPTRELRRAGAEDTAAPFAPSAFTTGRYRFPSLVTGTITYIETDLTADMPFDVHGFAEHAAIFPDDSTADQVFNHRQFEAFRALGYHQASKAFPAPVARV
ncbi:MAG TPA: hypothetical protein VM942_01985 [Acidimicrobiales bacterium]|nr:hypothetical protein [Acidimicrobiales bacterium]